MWKDYSVSFIKHNKASSISIMVAAFVSTLFLSLICTLFYNVWKSNIDQIVLNEGDWQGRLVGELSDQDIETVRNFANVKDLKTYRDKKERLVVDLYFENMRDVYKDLPQIVEQLGLEEVEPFYHDNLLSEYLIFNPQDDEHPLLLRFYIFVMLVTSVSLILMIRNAFSASMVARIHQLGILSSIGATPKQIKTSLLQEAFALSLLPILMGNAGGIGLCVCFFRYASHITRSYQQTTTAFYYHPVVFLITSFSALITVFFSAWLPARKMSKITPLEAIRNTSERNLKKLRHPLIFSKLFGVVGELAGNALKARKRDLRISTISLTLSFFAFTMFLIFSTLSEISTNHTYFESYKDRWDIMATVKKTNIQELELLPDLSKLEGVKSSVAYQKATSNTVIYQDQLSSDLINLGGISAIAGSSVKELKDKAWLTKVQLVIMDDDGFMEYCKQIGTEPRIDGAILLNSIWDSINSNFRYRKYIPFIQETMESLTLTNKKGRETGTKIELLAYTQIEPVLKEQYDDYTIVLFISSSQWKKLENTGVEVEDDTNIRIFVSDLSKIDTIEEEVGQFLSNSYSMVTTNRIREKIKQEEIYRGYNIVIGVLCGILAFIGIANIFSHTLGFLYQRKREFARYLSVGVTPAGIKKILWIEMIIIAGRPLVLTLPLAVVFTVYAINASYLDPAEFLPVMPVLPVLLFIIFIFAFVGLAYYIGGKRLLKSNLSEVLQNDTMV